MSEKDFEALGRYVDAKERASTLEMHRHNLAGDIGRLLSSASMGSTNYTRRFDHVSFLEKANELAKFNEQLEEAIAEVNGFADQAEKPKLTRD
jgi:hypothetical protein